MDNVGTMTEQIDDSIQNERTIALLATAFGVLAAVLAGIGLYGILAYYDCAAHAGNRNPHGAGSAARQFDRA